MKHFVFFRLVLVTGLTVSGYSHLNGQGVQKDLSDKSRKVLALTEGSEFTVDEHLVDKMFKSTTKTETQQGSIQRLGFAVDVGISQLLPLNMTLENRNFVVDYDRDHRNLPQFSVALRKHLSHDRFLSYELCTRTGYAYAQGIGNVHAKLGIDLRDTLSMQWIPLEAGLVSKSRSSYFGILKPSFAALVGTNWVNQDGTLDGIDQSLWRSTLTFLLGLQLFEGNSIDENSGFDGIAVAAGYQNSLNPKENFEVASLGITSNFRF